MPRTIVDLPTDDPRYYFNRGLGRQRGNRVVHILIPAPAVVLAIKPQKAHPAPCHCRCYVGAAGRYFVCSCCRRRSIARAICSCSSAILVKPCSRKRSALARCHFADFSSPGFSGLSSVDIGCPLEEMAQELASQQALAKLRRKRKSKGKGRP